MIKRTARRGTMYCATRYVCGTPKPIKSMSQIRKKRERKRKATSFRFRPETMTHLAGISNRTGWSITMSCERAVAFAAVHREFGNSSRTDS